MSLDVWKTGGRNSEKISKIIIQRIFFNLEFQNSLNLFMKMKFWGYMLSEIKSTFQWSTCFNAMNSKLTTNFLKTQIQESSKGQNLQSGHEGKIWSKGQYIAIPYPLTRTGRNRFGNGAQKLRFSFKPVLVC